MIRGNCVSFRRLVVSSRSRWVRFQLIRTYYFWINASFSSFFMMTCLGTRKCRVMFTSRSDSENSSRWYSDCISSIVCGQLYAALYEMQRCSQGRREGKRHTLFAALPILSGWMMIPRVACTLSIDPMNLVSALWPSPLFQPSLSPHSSSYFTRGSCSLLVVSFRRIRLGKDPRLHSRLGHILLSAKVNEQSPDGRVRVVRRKVHRAPTIYQLVVLFPPI